MQLLRHVPGHLLVLHTDRALESYDDQTGALIAASTFPFMPYGIREGLVANSPGACGSGPAGAEVEAACIDPLGAIVWRKTYPLRKPTDPPSSWYLVRELDTRWLVVSTWSSGTAVQRGIVVRLSDGLEMARVEESISAAVTGVDGELEALLVTQPHLRLLDAKGALRWASSERPDDAASAVLVGSSLIVASFHPISTGADLRAFDVSSGKLSWTGALSLLPIAHSKYSNHVRLDLAFGHLVVHGNESAQRYLELFDPKDGTRLLAEVRALW